MPDEHKRKPITEVIANIKDAAVQRCADRIEAARNKPKDEKESKEDTGITSILKRNRGL
jgi:hypothetical protein